MNPIESSMVMSVVDDRSRSVASKLRSNVRHDGW